MKILVVEDDEHLLVYLKKVLEVAGYEVITAKDGEEALNIFYDHPVDMIISDEMMPKMSGNELLSAIRKEKPDIPFIMETAKGMIGDKKASFDLGVDDYLVKPIDKDELVMRIEALARRVKIRTEKRIRVKDTVLDYEMHTISNSVRGEKVTLSPTEFQILYLLLSYTDKSFTKWEIFERFWDVGSDVDEDIVKVFISKIRKAIAPFPEIEIETLMSIGYRGVRHE